MTRPDGLDQAEVSAVLAGADQRACAPKRPDDPAEIRARLAEDERELLGRLVRAVWTTWAAEQPDVAEHPSWLIRWEKLPERDREVNRRIGATVAVHVGERIAQAIEAARPAPPDRQNAPLGTHLGRLAAYDHAARIARETTR